MEFKEKELINISKVRIIDIPLSKYKNRIIRLK